MLGASACIIVEGFAPLAADSTVANVEGGTPDAPTCPPTGCTDASVLDADADAETPGRVRWVTTFSSEGPDVAPGFGDVRAIADGGAVVVTSFRGSLGLGGTSAGGYDVAIVKLDRDGHVVWSRTFGGSGDDMASAVSVDETGAIWLAGSSTSDPTAFSAVPNPGGLALPYVVKLDSAGMNPVALAFDLSGVTTGACSALSASKNGRVVVGCDFAGTIGMTGTGAWSETSTNGSVDALVLSVDVTSRAPMWRRTFGGDGTDRVVDVAAPAFGDAVATGWFDSTTLAPGAVARIGTGVNAWVAALDPNAGASRWTKGFGQTISNGITRGHAVAADRPSGVIAGGDVRGEIDFGGFNRLTSSSRVAFAMRLDSDAGDGTAIVGLGGTISSTRGIAVDVLGERTFLGEMTLASDGKPEIGNVALPPFGTGTAGFVVKNVGGGIAWLKTFSSDFGQVYPRRVSVGDERELTIMGRFVGTTAFGDGIPRSSGPLGSTFVVRFAP